MMYAYAALVLMCLGLSYGLVRLLHVPKDEQKRSNERELNGAGDCSGQSACPCPPASSAEAGDLVWSAGGYLPVKPLGSDMIYARLSPGWHGFNGEWHRQSEACSTGGCWTVQAGRTD